jgi:SAM-dependent methyltransferase
VAGNGLSDDGKDLSERQINHRAVWEKKAALRLLYRDFHRQLIGSCPEGRILDIGGGTAHIKEIRPDIVTTDIMRFPGIDVVADAHQLPFPDRSFSGIVMLDVLHHLERPIAFLNEAARLLDRGGRLAMMEPAMTTLGRPFYHYFHEEPVDMTADPYALVTTNPDRDPFDANQAIPTLLFRDAASCARLESTIPSLRVLSVDWQSLFAYPLSGGFQSWSLIPGAAVQPVLALERRFPNAVRKHLAFRVMVVLERR